ncbi:hypothetical protein D3C76_988360 [compost metagenome]
MQRSRQPWLAPGIRLRSWPICRASLPSVQAFHLHQRRAAAPCGCVAATSTSAAAVAAASPLAARHAPRAAARAAPIARPASLWGAAALVRCCFAEQRNRPCGARPGVPPPRPWAGGGLAPRKALPQARRYGSWLRLPQGAELKGVRELRVLLGESEHHEAP